MTPDSLGDLFLHPMNDMPAAKASTLPALPTIKRKATDARLKAARKAHLAQTDQHLRRLHALFDQIGTPARVMGRDHGAQGLTVDPDAARTVDGGQIDQARPPVPRPTFRRSPLAA